MTRAKRTEKTMAWRWLTAVGMALSLIAGIIVCEHASAQTTEKTNASQSPSALAKYARDLTKDAEQGRFNSVNDRSEEVARAIDILSRDRKNNPVILSESQ